MSRLKFASVLEERIKKERDRIRRKMSEERNEEWKREREGGGGGGR
jgi:hypothetical protein